MTAGEGSQCEDRTTILLVEDNQDSSEALSVLLESAGHRVIVVSSGGQALEAYRRERDRIRVVLTDLAMPQMNGVELYCALRAENLTAPVIVFSGYPQPAAPMAGITAWLQKPVDIEDLLAAVNATLGPGA